MLRKGTRKCSPLEILDTSIEYFKAHRKRTGAAMQCQGGGIKMEMDSVSLQGLGFCISKQLPVVLMLLVH